MPVYVITFALNQTLDMKRYRAFFQAIEDSSHPYVRLSSATYAVRVSTPAAKILDKLKPLLPLTTDYVFVVEVVGPIADRFDGQVRKWFRTHLNESQADVEVEFAVPKHITTDFREFEKSLQKKSQ